MADSDCSHSPTNEYEHFPSLDDRARSSTKNMSKSGRVSPAHSAHGSLLRSSLMQITIEKKAKKVRFYRNGDRFYKGILYAVSPERFRTFESLLAELTSSPLGDRTVLPNGVRHIFSIDGSQKITSLDQLEEEESYVCCSTQLFKKIDYPRSSTPCWNKNQRSGQQDVRDGAASPLPRYSSPEDEVRDYVKPKLVTVIRNGTKPRKAVRILLNKKTAQYFDQVLTDITDAIKLDSGAVRKVFTIDGRPVTKLEDFFRDDSMFIAYGLERYSHDDFDLGGNEIKFVSAYKSVRQKERITLRSPKPQRRLPVSASMSSTHSTPPGMDIPPRKLSSPNKMTMQSPKASRKVTQHPQSTVPACKFSNGHVTNGNGNDDSPMNGPTNLMSKYKIGKVIGEGNFAIVKECIEKASKKQFALKVINKKQCKGKEQMIENEVSILRRVKHSNIIQLVEEFDTHTELYLIVELVAGGDLFDAISSATKYTERDASGMLYNLGCAIKYLHSLNIVHRDIKPENILVYEHEDGSKSLKLGDFGLATVVVEPLYTVCGTPTYVAPEVLAENGYGLLVDVWSAGVITYILLCGFPPFVSTSSDQDELFDKIMAGELKYPAPFWDEISSSAKELISGMLVVPVEERLTAGEMLNHPWVSDDVAKDEDMHSRVATRLQTITSKAKKRTHTAGVAVITSTALDKGSRFFQGRKSNHNVSGFSNQDEVF